MDILIYLGPWLPWFPSKRSADGNAFPLVSLPGIVKVVFDSQYFFVLSLRSLLYCSGIV